MKLHFVLGLAFVSAICICQSSPPEYSWDTITFEEAYVHIQIGTNEMNLWEIGEPGKSLFDAAFRGEKAIITSLSETYSNNNHSYFDLKLSYFNIGYFPYSVFIQFEHKYDTEINKDGAYIEVSYDNGISWTNVLHDQNSCTFPAIDPGTMNLYTLSDTLFNGESGFSGSSGGWITTKFGWAECLTKDMGVNADTMLLRFNFISDNTDSNHEGWMIDDIRLYSVKLYGSSASEMAEEFKVFPNPADDIIYVYDAFDTKLKKLSLYTLSGIQLTSEVNAFSLNLSFLDAGIYLLRIDSEDLFVYKRIVVKH